LKHDQARTLLDLILHKRQESGGIRAGLRFITARKRKARNEKRQKKRAMQAAHALKLSERTACCSFFGPIAGGARGRKAQGAKYLLDLFLSNESGVGTCNRIARIEQKTIMFLRAFLVPSVLCEGLRPCYTKG
jgi:hypothetical protein